MVYDPAKPAIIARSVSHNRNSIDEQSRAQTRSCPGWFVCMNDIFHGMLGLTAFCAIAWAASENRKAVSLKLVAAGIAMQLIVALIMLKLPWVGQVFTWLNEAVGALQNATEAGAGMVFGYLGGGPLPFEEKQPGASFILAFRALPLVILVSALTALLTYWGLLQWVVRGISKLLERSLQIGGAVGLGTAANVFVGMVEAPLFIRAYLHQLSRAELFMLMTAGMATVAGTVLVLYAGFVAEVMPDAIGHLLTASLISAPAAITMARIMVPTAETPTGGGMSQISDASSSMDALTRGTMSGLQLFLNIVAMLLVFVALVHLLNSMLGLLPDLAGQPITLERLFGYLMAPLAWLMGVPWSEAATAGSLMGVKTVLNEFLAYIQFAALPEDALSPRSDLIMAYALCGFANFGSLGIMIGGLTTLVPERQADFVELGMKSILAGTLATCCTGAIVGML